MKSAAWSSLTAAYLIAISFLSALAMIDMVAQSGNRDWMVSQSGDPDWVSFAILLTLTMATTRMNFDLPRAGRPVRLSFLFCFAAITVLPPAAAFVVAAAAEADSILARKKRDRRWHVLAFPMLLLPVCVYATSAVYHALLAAAWLRLPLTTVVAGLTYYVVESALSSLQIAIETRRAPWLVWNEQFFWLGPVYLLAPIGVSIVLPVLDSPGTAEGFLALGLILVGYGYLKNYWNRLQHHEEHVQEIADIRQRAIEMLAAAIESKDGGSALHLRRVKSAAARLGRKLGCSAEEIEMLELAALLHDIGKVGVPDYILMKPGRLTEHEFSQIASHSAVGAAIVESARFPGPVGEIVRCHHEHWDGQGYPKKLQGEAIPRLARILTVVDCFDALISDRPYRPALSLEVATEVLKEQRGKIFDPEILDAFLEEVPAYWADIQKEHPTEREEEVSDGTDTLHVEQSWVSDGEENATALRHQSLRRLTRNPDQLLAFYEILDMLGADLHFEKSLHECLRILYRPIPYDKAGIFLLEHGDYILVAAQGLPEHCLSRMTLPQDHGVVAQATISRSCVVADAPPSEIPGEGPPRYLDDVKSTIAAPLFVDEQVVGMLVLCASEAGAFDQEQARSLNLVTAKLARTLLSSKAVQRISLEAETDPVTALPNARGAFRRLEAEVSRAQRTKGTIGVLFMDINGLKPVNDSFGHSAGDELLIETARRLQGRLRGYDYAARVGGDEFLAILPGVSREDLAVAVDSMKTAIAETAVKVSDDVYAQVTIAIGSALYPYDGVDPEDLVNLSDQRMYEEKERTRSGPDSRSRSAEALAVAAV